MRKKLRKSNFELLRIIAMLLIIAGHLGGQGFEKVSSAGLVWISIFGNGSRIAVNLFLMIGIWFMVDSDFKASKLLSIYSRLWIYSAGISLIVFSLGGDASVKELLSSFFPFLRRSLWFVTSYLSLMLLAPYLKIFWENCDKIVIERFLVLAFCLTCMMCSFAKIMDTYLCTVIWFVYMYFFVAYYKKFLWSRISRKGVWLFLGITIYILLVLGRIVCQLHEGAPFESLDKVLGQFLGDYKSMPNFMISFSVFVFFSKLDIGTNKLINFLSRNTLDVYIIHQVPVFYPILWKGIFRTTQWQMSRNFGIFYLSTIIIVFIICSIIGVIRERLLDSWWMKSSIYNMICDKLECFYTPLYR